jgi:hypothetical protein
MSLQPQSEFESPATDGEQIAAMAKSLRATLMRGTSSRHITAAEAADIVELVELLANSVAYLERRVQSQIIG